MIGSRAGLKAMTMDTVDAGQIKPSWKMKWHGKVHPYVRTTQRQKWCDPRYKRYAAFKGVFRLSANTQGVIQALDSTKRYWLSISLRVKGSLRADLDNIIKSVSDSLWDQDNRVKTIWAAVEENAYDDECTVELYEL